MRSNINNSTSTWILGLFITFSIIFTVSPYFRGLFFYDNSIYVNVLIQIVFLITIARFYKPFLKFVQENVQIFMFVVGILLFLQITYFFSTSPYYAMNELLQWVMYLVVFVMIAFWTSISEKNIGEWIWNVMLLTLGWITALVYLVDFGILEYQDAVFGRDNRFSSVFQYPNTLASLLSAFVIALLVKLSQNKVSKYYLYLYGSMLVPLTVAFLLSNSRGGFLVAGIVGIIALIFLKFKQQLIYIFYSISLILISFVGYTLYQSSIVNENSVLAFVYLLGVSVLYLVLIFLGQKYIFEKYDMYFDKITKVRFILPIAAFSLLTAGGVVLSTKLVTIFSHVLPQGIYNRLTAINLAEHSVQERLLFYKDSFKVFLDHFWIGAGGGGWRVLFEQYKSLPYFSNEAHSFYMQNLVEMGLIGSIMVFGLIGYIITKGFISYFRQLNDEKVSTSLLGPTLIVVITLMLHNAIDFNMSFATYNLFVFSLLGILWGYTYTLNEKQVTNHTLIHRIGIGSRKYLIMSLIAIIVLTSLLTLYKSSAFVRAESLFKEAQNNDDYYQIMNRLEKAQNLNKHSPKILDANINILKIGYEHLGEAEIAEKIVLFYEKLIASQPTNHNNYLKYADYLWNEGQLTEAIEQVKFAQDNGPWVQDVIKKSIDYSLNYIMNNPDDSISETLFLVNVLEDLQEKLKKQTTDIPQGLRLTNPIELTTDNRVIFANGFYYTGNFEAAIEFLSPIDVTILNNDEQMHVLLILLLSYDFLGSEDEVDNILTDNSYLSNILEEAKLAIEWLPFN